jgi:hypothetical protein
MRLIPYKAPRIQNHTFLKGQEGKKKRYWIFEVVSSGSRLGTYMHLLLRKDSVRLL